MCEYNVCVYLKYIYILHIHLYDFIHTKVEAGEFKVCKVSHQAGDLGELMLLFWSELSRKGHKGTEEQKTVEATLLHYPTLLREAGPLFYSGLQLIG
jgi:hypothetical protein